MESNKEQLSGLKSRFSPVGIWAFSIGTSIGWGSVIVTCSSYLGTSGIYGTVFGLLLGMAVIFVITWNLQYMIQNNPDAGGIYTFEKKVAGKELGFVALWFILMAYFAVLWANITAIPLFARIFLKDTFKIGLHYHIFGYDVWLGEFILSALILVAVGYLCANSLKLPGYVVTVAALIFVIGFALCAAVALLDHDSSFNYYPFFNEESSALSQIVRIASISPWAFIGFENISHFAEEYSFSAKKVRGILFSSVIVSTTIYILVCLLSVSAYPQRYTSWIEYIRDMGNLSGIEAQPIFYAADHYMGRNGVTILMLALIGVILTSLIGNMMALSRILYAAGREGELPKEFSEVNERGIPHKAFLVVCAISFLVPLLGRTTIGWIVDVTTLGATLIYALISHAVFLKGLKNGDKVIRVTGIIGMVLMGLYIVLLLVPGLLPFNAMETESYALFIAWSIAGLLYFRHIINKDEHREYKERMIVWVIFLVLLMFASMMWVSRVTENAAEEAVQNIYEYHHAHHEEKELSAEEVAEDETFIKGQAERVSSTNTLYTLVTLFLFAISMLVMMNNYRDNQELGQKLTAAEVEAQSAKKIADLRESIANLMDNMPVITFSKDAQTGKYIACNQAFADFVSKGSPEEVVGYTDHELFDRVTADRFVAEDKVALETDETYVLYEDLTDPEGNYRRLQTTKLKFHDANGRRCILGMALDETEIMTVRKEKDETQAAYDEVKSTSAIYGKFLNALSEDYFDLYYVDIENDEFVEYGSVTEKGKLGNVNLGRNFFAEAREQAFSYVYEDDQKRFVEEFRKENILDDIRKMGAFVCQYRLMIDGVPTYVNMKATSIPDDDQHIIIGINNVDSQVKDRMAAERAMEEQKTYLRLSALNGNLLVLYLVDPETEHYREFSSSLDFEKLGVAKEGEEFFATTNANGQKVVYSEDLPLFNSAVNKKNIFAAIEQNGVFELDYRLVMGDSPIYIRLKAAMVEEDGKKLLIVGILDVDSQVRHEQEYADNMAVANRLATKDDLTGVGNKYAYSNLEDQINAEIEDGNEPEFAIVVCDVNGLKVVNDTLGHKAGDAFLQNACVLICNVFVHSPVFRIGGDEFAVVCQGRDYDNIGKLMDQMHDANAYNRDRGEVQVAYGMSKYDGDGRVAAVFERADKLMYERKSRMKSEVNL